MNTVTRTQLLVAMFGLSLCGLGYAASTELRAQVTTPQPIIIDDGDAGFSQKNFVGSSPYSGAYNNDMAFSLPFFVPTGETAEAEWKHDVVAGTYDVYMTWGAHSMFATDVSVQVSGQTASAPVIINQSAAPAGLTHGGHTWQPVGAATLTTDGTITVVMETSTQWNKYSVADAVLMIKREAPATIAAACGNGAKEGAEQCDDGNAKPGDGCSSSCVVESCGDEIVTPSLGEECDGWSDINTQESGTHKVSCDQCKWAYCGDSRVNVFMNEQCDDGNRRNGDGCSSLCQIDSIVAATVCNDGRDNDNDGKIDLLDAGCENAQDGNEANGGTDIGIKVFETILSGNSIIFSPTITNYGPDAVTTPIEYAITFPRGVTPNQPVVDQNCSTNGNVITCSVDAFPDDQEFTHHFTFAITDPACDRSVLFGAQIRTTPQGDYETSNNSTEGKVAIPCSSATSSQATSAAGGCALPAKTASRWQNQTNPLDVDNNGIVNRDDSYALISRVIRGGMGALPTAGVTSGPFYNVNGNYTSAGAESFDSGDVNLVTEYLKCTGQSAPAQNTDDSDDDDDDDD